MRLSQLPNNKWRWILRPGWQAMLQVQTIVANGTACHSSLIYSLWKPGTSSATETAFCLSLNYCRQPSQNVHSLCTVWLHANCGCVLGVTFERLDSWQWIVFARSPLSHPFPVAVPRIRPFHFLSISPLPWGSYLFWLSPSLILSTDQRCEHEPESGSVARELTSCKLERFECKEQHVAEGNMI